MYYFRNRELSIEQVDKKLQVTWSYRGGMLIKAIGMEEKALDFKQTIE